MATYGVHVRRGLPRRTGGAPWPEGGNPSGGAGSGDKAGMPAHSAALPVSPSSTDVMTAPTAPRTARRRGLPRLPGTDTSPGTGLPPDAPVDSAAPAMLAAGTVAEPKATASIPRAAPARRGLPRAGANPPPAAAPIGPTLVTERPPLSVPQTVFPGVSAQQYTADRRSRGKVVRPEPARIGPFTKKQWAASMAVTAVALLIAGGMLIALVRWLLSLEFMQEFTTNFPGEYPLPETAPVGVPAWIGWQHFFNVFLMVLIIRSGLQVRTEKRPTAFWTRRGSSGNAKISLNLWFHQSLDILWLVNGITFVVLLFATGQWMRIVPTSWEVFPNAVSAALQYVSLDWPTENGWVNYNSLQQLAYFATVFLAAPLAAITGVRMSGLWPKNTLRLNRLYPVEWARTIHFPVMIYFVLFIVLHVTLVLATGALRNLNHMYAAQGSVSGEQYADNWAGFWMFAASIFLIAGGWIAARPLVLAPIARLFGTVSGR
ncbi:MAG: cytochrome b/b6 domain-containing protein [Mycetocola sp.]